MTKQSKSSKNIENKVVGSETDKKVLDKRKEVMAGLESKLHHYIILGQLDDRIVYRTTVAWATNKKQASRYETIDAVKKELAKLSESQIKHIKVFEVTYTEIDISNEKEFKQESCENDAVEYNKEPENTEGRTGKLYWFETIGPVSVNNMGSGDNFVGYCDYPIDIMHTESAQQLMTEEVKKWNKTGAGVSIYYVRVNGPYPDGSYVLDYGSHSRFFKITRA